MYILYIICMHQVSRASSRNDNLICLDFYIRVIYMNNRNILIIKLQIRSMEKSANKYIHALCSALYAFDRYGSNLPDGATKLTSKSENILTVRRLRLSRRKLCNIVDKPGSLLRSFIFITVYN